MRYLNQEGKRNQSRKWLQNFIGSVLIILVATLLYIVILENRVEHIVGTLLASIAIILAIASIVALRNRYTKDLEMRVAQRTQKLQQSNTQLRDEIEERRQLETTLAQHAFELTALNDAATDLNSTLNFDTVLERILVNVEKLIPHDSANIMLLDSDEAYVARHQGYAEQGRESSTFDQRFVVTHMPSLHAMAKSGQPCTISDTQFDTTWIDVPGTSWVRSYVGAPIELNEQIIGFLNLNSAKPGFFTPAHGRRLKTFAQQAAVSIENARRYTALRHHISELEERVADRTDALGEIAGKLKMLDKLKDNFVSNVSHELRAPLANIKLYLGLLEHGRLDKRDRYLKTLNRETIRLQRLIESLLDISHAESDITDANMDAIDLNRLIADLVTDRSRLAAQQGLSLDCAPDLDLPLALADPAMSMQVMSNLMTNAINFTPQDGHITLLTNVRERENHDWITFSVQDNGPGISDKELPNLFKRFFQGDAAQNSTTKGTGLGLAICKEIVNKMNGHITVESQLGQGAVFTVWLKPADADETPPLSP